MEQLIAKYNKKIIIALATIVGLFIIFIAAIVLPTFRDLANIKIENERLKRSITLADFYTRQAKKVWGEKAQACTPATVNMVDSSVIKYGKGEITSNAVLAVMTIESGFNIKVKSPTGPTGLMQLALATAQAHEDTIVAKNLINPVINTRLGIKELLSLKAKFEGDMDLVLKAYNRGPRNVKEIIGMDSDNYSWNVFKHSYEFAEMEKRF